MSRNLKPQPPAWVAQYMTVPFANRGRTREGADCWGGLRLAYLEQFQIFLPSYGAAYANADDVGGVQAVFAAAEGEWAKLNGPAQVGDVALFRIEGDKLHVGMAVDLRRMLHWQAGVGATLEDWASPLWSPRLLGWYRYNAVPVTYRANPLAPPGRLLVGEGSSLADIASLAGLGATGTLRAFVGGSEVPAAAWANVRPRAGVVVEFSTSVPEGGGNGNKTALRIVLTIAVIVASIYLGPGLAAWYVGGTATATQAAVGSAVISLVGTLAINALVPPSAPRLSEEGASRSSPSIAGSRNVANPWGVVPVPLGLVRVVPPYGALPYTEIVGDDQYVRCLFTVMGPVDISDIRIGTTSVEDLDDVEIEIRNGYPTDAPLRLFPDAVHEDPLTVALTAAGSWQTRTTQTGTDEIGVDITFPSGLAHVNADGSKSNRTVSLEVQYSVAGAGVWTTINLASPAVARELDILFRAPEVTLGGNTFIGTAVNWGAGFANAKPGYLPATPFSWRMEGYVQAPVAGVYHFGVDGSDAIDLEINGAPVASWYGTHNPVGGNAAPADFTVHNGAVTLTAGYHKIVLRMESRSANAGAVALGWKKPGDVAYSVVPIGNLWRGPSPLLHQPRVAWYITDDYSSALGLTDRRTEPIRRNHTWAVPRGQYDVRIRRTTADAVDDRDIDLVFWTAIRSTTNEDPLPEPGLAKVAIRIRATDQLNGTVDTLNFMAHSIRPDWDVATGTWITRATSRPGSLYRAVLQGNGMKRPVVDGKIDLVALQDWVAVTNTLGLEFNAILDFKGTVYERLRDITSAGRGSYTNRNGKHSVVVDQPQTVPVQHFTERNIRKDTFTGRKAFPDVFHGLRVRFMDAANDYTQAERVVLDDGYSILKDGVYVDAFGDPAPSLPVASKFETLELFGVTSADEVWKHARYHLATIRLRPEVFEFETDVEHLVCTRGDLVLVRYDVPLIGLHSGRVTAVTLDSVTGNVAGVVVDEEITMVSGPAYAVRFRLSGDGSSVYAPVLANAGIGHALTFVTPIDIGDPHPEVGDLFMFGEADTETRPMVIKSIVGTRDLGARLSVVDHAPEVHDADTGVIPPYDPGITIPPVFGRGPEAPVVDYVQSDDYVMVRGADGSLEVRMLIVLHAQTGTRELGTTVEVRTREQGYTGPWTAHATGPAETLRYSCRDLEEGTTYDVRIRYTVPTNGHASDWTEFVHTVVGKSAPPPDVVSFAVARLSDGTRRYTFDLGTIPPDVAGVQIRYGPGGVGAWNALTPLHDNNLEASSPQELNAPAAGYWRFGIKMIDTSGNLSTNAVFVDKLLGAPRMDGVAISEDAYAVEWPGTRTNCFLNDSKILEATSTTTWATLPATWAAWHRWNLTPRTPITYTHTTIDAGFLFHTEPSVYVDATGSTLSEVRWSEDGVAWSAWTDVTTLLGTTVYGRYFGFRCVVTATGGDPIPRLLRFGMFLRAPAVTQEIPDLDTSTMPTIRRFGPGDIRLPIAAGQFSVVRSVSIGFNGTGAGWSWEFIDKDADNGPHIRIYNPADELADAVIDAVIRGL